MIKDERGRTPNYVIDRDKFGLVLRHQPTGEEARLLAKSKAQLAAAHFLLKKRLAK